MSVSTATELAIEAFEKQEQARVRLVLAERRARKALGNVPQNEIAHWYQETEKIRAQMAKKYEEYNGQDQR